MTPRRRRVTIGTVPLVIQPTPEEVQGFERPRHGELISEIPARAEDLREGRRRFEIVVRGWRFEATVEPADRAELRERAKRAAAEHQAAVALTLRAQIPGRVVRMWVEEGEQVEEGQRLLAIEAMKMENEIRAPHAGVVSGIGIEVGSRVERDDELLTVSQDVSGQYTGADG